MSNESFQSVRPRRLALVTVVGLLVICALTVMAQSGRRAPKTTSIPAPTPESSPTPTAKKAPEKPALPLIVGIDAQGSFSNIPLYFYDTVLQSCADRLRESSLKVEVGSRDFNRGDAVKRAKAEKEGYVVLLQLRADSIGSSNSNTDLSQVYIDYFVFAPTTAKQVTSGHAYQQAYRNRGVVLGPGTSGNIAYAEYRLKQAARDAAERILSGLHLAPPPGVMLPQP